METIDYLRRLLGKRPDQLSETERVYIEHALEAFEKIRAARGAKLLPPDPNQS